MQKNPNCHSEITAIGKKTGTRTKFLMIITLYITTLESQEYDQ